MNVLGISGLHYSAPFKKKNFSDLSPRQYRIVQGLDSAAALATPEGIRTAAAQERFSREKGTGSFPIDAIEYCLRSANLTYHDIDFVAHGFHYEPFREWFENSGEYTRNLFRTVYSQESLIQVIEEHIPEAAWREKIISVEHHLAHAASAFYLSGFDESLILVADGMGEIHSATLAIGENNSIRIIEQIPASHSLGILYGVFTLYLGFFMNMDEYKVMGLASFGDPRRYFSAIMDLVHINNDGTYTIPILLENSGLLEKETYEGTLLRIEKMLGPRRTPEMEITKEHQDIAAAVQAVLQTTLMHVLRHFKRLTRQRNLCMAGGVALNCTANSVIKRSRLFERVFVQPAAGDDGTALGAALHAYGLHKDGGRLPRMGSPLWGPSYEREAIEKSLRRHPDCKSKFFPCFLELAREVAERIAAGQVVAWFQGRMEFGPRALGNRSILADPRDLNMRQRLNLLIKRREDFRPFAPAVMAEDACRYFEIDPGDEAAYSHMLFVAPVRPKYREKLPAITHVDGSARVQTVSRDDNPRFWMLLREFADLTSLPVLLNTSLNVRGQPIVCSPDEALDTYLATELDILVLGDYLVVRGAGWSGEMELIPCE